MGSGQCGLVSFGPVPVTLGGLADPFLPWVAFEFMKTIRIKVKRKHIVKGSRGDALSCPIQLAMRDLGFERHAVCLGNIEFNGPDGSINETVSIPREADDFILAFDHSKPVKPFEFTIEVPSKLVPQPLLIPE